MKTMNLITVENQNMSINAQYAVENAKENLTLSALNAKENITVSVKNLQSLILQSKAVVILTLVVSICLGEDVKPARALWLLSALVSGLSAFLFGGFGLAIQLALLAWFALSILALKR